VRYVIWCQVIDHFGDAGVCWRLARTLAQELSSGPDLEIILAIDRPAVLGRLVPAFDSANLGRSDTVSMVDGVRIVDWQFPALEVDVMISAFGCRLPHGVLETMGQQDPPPIWINLEHLSPQTWVNSCHTLPSPNPINGLPEVFFFPGFDPQTGGLLREANLLERRDRFHADPQARDVCLAELGVGQADRQLPALLAFGYADAPLDVLIQTLAQGEPMLLLLPSGPAPTVRHGALRVHAFGWVPQSDFDRLLWCCSAAFVRGEDSLVRAHWAAIPFIWQPYRQRDRSHHDQLDAWLERWQPFLSEPAAQAQVSLARAWDRGDRDHLPAAWSEWLECLPELQTGAAAWSRQLAAGPSLVHSLGEFVRDRLESRSPLSHSLRHSRLDSR